MTTAERSAAAERPASREVTLTAYVEWDESVSRYVGSIPGVSGAHTQGATLDELRDNLRDVLETLAEEGMIEQDELPCFVGLQQITVAV